MGREEIPPPLLRPGPSCWPQVLQWFLESVPCQDLGDSVDGVGEVENSADWKQLHGAFSPEILLLRLTDLTQGEGSVEQAFAVDVGRCDSRSPALTESQTWEHTSVISGL